MKTSYASYESFVALALVTIVVLTWSLCLLRLWRWSSQYSKPRPYFAWEQIERIRPAETARTLAPRVRIDFHDGRSVLGCGLEWHWLPSWETVNDWQQQNELYELYKLYRLRGCPSEANDVGS